MHNRRDGFVLLLVLLFSASMSLLMWQVWEKVVLVHGASVMQHRLYLQQRMVRALLRVALELIGSYGFLIHTGLQVQREYIANIGDWVGYVSNIRLRPSEKVLLSLRRIDDNRLRCMVTLQQGHGLPVQAACSVLFAKGVINECISMDYCLGTADG